MPAAQPLGPLQKYMIIPIGIIWISGIILPINATKLGTL
jgi:hypothetical protein